MPVSANVKPRLVMGAKTGVAYYCSVLAIIFIVGGEYCKFLKGNCDFRVFQYFKILLQIVDI